MLKPNRTIANNGAPKNAIARPSAIRTAAIHADRMPLKKLLIAATLSSTK